MRQWRTFLLSLLVATLLCFQLVQPLLAAPIADAPADTALDPSAYGVTCTAGVCTLHIKDAGIAVPDVVAAGATLLLTFLQDQIHLLPDGAGLRITDDVTIQTPMGKLALFGTDMIIELAADNTVERLRGTAEIPWPSLLGASEGSIQHALAVADIGLEPGKYLTHLNVPLAAEQRYFYMRLGAGLATDTTGALQRETLHAIDSPVTRGQYLTLIVDPTALDVMLDGNLTIAMLDELLLFNQFLTDQTGLPFELASEAVNVHLSGLVSGNLRDSYLRVDGLYTLEKQFIRNWFQTDASPLAVTGSLLINQEGVLLSGLTRSSILPDRLFDGEMRVEAFLPLNGNLWGAYVAAGSQADLPLLALQHAGEQTLSAAPLQAVVDDALASMQPLFVVVQDSATDVVVYAARGYQTAQAVASNSYAWTVETVIDGTTSATNAAWAGVHSVQDLATVSYHWTADVVALGAAQTIALARNTYSWTATQVDQGATAIAGATATGYQATRDLAGNTYSWTAATTSTSVAAVSAVAVGSYGAVMAGAASQIDTLAAWLWPSTPVVAEANLPDNLTE